MISPELNKFLEGRNPKLHVAALVADSERICSEMPAMWEAAQALEREGKAIQKAREAQLRECDTLADEFDLIENRGSSTSDEIRDRIVRLMASLKTTIKRAEILEGKWVRLFRRLQSIEDEYTQVRSEIDRLRAA